MSEFRDKYRAAMDAYKRYRDAPQKGWAVPGSRSSANQTIEVPRKEAQQLADNLASAWYIAYSKLYEVMALANYIAQLAEDEPDAAVCPKCHRKYRSGWMDGKCPYCAAQAAATEKVDEELEME